jgi:hypothetical protein
MSDFKDFPKKAIPGLIKTQVLNGSKRNTQMGLKVVFSKRRIGNFLKSSWTKTEFFFGFSMKFCLEIREG